MLLAIRQSGGVQFAALHLTVMRCHRRRRCAEQICTSHCPSCEMGDPNGGACIVWCQLRLPVGGANLPCSSCSPQCADTTPPFGSLAEPMRLHSAQGNICRRPWTPVRISRDRDQTV